jgi:hypothetical protein
MWFEMRKKNNLNYYFFRIIRAGFVRLVLKPFNKLLHCLECFFSKKHNTKLKYPPIFIIGAPRSGSTLLYQVLASYFDLGYLSNAHAYFWGAPSWFERIFKFGKKRYISDYKSSHGRTKGLLAPSECGEFWYRFFRRKPAYVTIHDADPKRMQCLRRAVISLTNAFNKPVLFKNMHCALRLEALGENIPEALYIVIYRDITRNAYGLLETRKKVYGDYRSWWSMEPKDIDKLKLLPVYQQVVEQIKHIYYDIAEFEKNIMQNKRIMWIKYEDFCDHPQQILNNLDAFFKKYGLELMRFDFNIPNQFLYSDHINIDVELYKKMKSYIETNRSFAKE